MSGDRSKRMPPSGGRATTEDNFADCGRFADHVRAVYDAAMALVQHEIDMMEQGVKNPLDWDRYYDALHEACRRAKEGK